MALLALAAALCPAAFAGPSVRLPSAELGAVIAQRAFGRGESQLTEREKALARSVYGDALDLDAVRVAYAWSPSGEPVTLGDTIRVPPGHELSTGTLVHELAHVWQFQTRGSAYISDSLLSQGCELLAGSSRDRAYDYALVPGKSLLDYSAEQQAQILEDYAVDPAKRLEPRYRDLAAAARALKFVRGARVILMERDAGLTPRSQPLPPGPQGPPPFGGEAGGVPQVELRF